jgi:hypothetical protein
MWVNLPVLGGYSEKMETTRGKGVCRFVGGLPFVGSKAGQDQTWDQAFMFAIVYSQGTR